MGGTSRSGVLGLWSRCHSKKDSSRGKLSFLNIQYVLSLVTHLCKTHLLLFLKNYKQANIEIKDGDNLTNEIASKIKTMMEQKVAAVERIMENAGNMAQSSSDEVDEIYDYYNAKNLTNNLTESAHEDRSELVRLKGP